MRDPKQYVQCTAFGTLLIAGLLVLVYVGEIAAYGELRSEGWQYAGITLIVPGIAVVGWLATLVASRRQV